MSRRDQTNIHPPVANITQPSKHFVLKHLEQLGLDVQVHVSNFIQENRALVRDFQDSALALDGSRKSSPLVPEQLGFQEVAGEPATIQVQKRLGRTPSVVVHPPRQYSLASAGFTLNEHGTVSGSDPGRQFSQFEDRGAVAEEGIHSPARVTHLLRRLFLLVALVLHASLDEQDKGGEICRLGKKVFGAQFDRVHRQVNGAVAGKNDDRDGGIDALEAWQQFHGIAVRQLVIEHDRIGLCGPPRPFPFGTGPCGLDLVAFTAEIIAD